MNDKPGINGESFKLSLTPDMFRDSKLLDNIDTTYLEILSEPVKHRYQWYWKVLYYLTFGVFFWEYYTYDVKIKQDECNKDKTTNG